MGKEVFVLGVGMMPIGKQKKLCIGRMGAASLTKAIEDAGLELDDVSALYTGNMMAGQLCSQQLVATIVSNYAGLTGVETITAEGACGSGAAAARMGYMAVASGCHKIVGVCGVEKMTHRDKEITTQALATASYRGTESGKGETFLTLNAQLMKRYMSTYNIPSERFSGFSINAHKNALSGPHAMLKKPVVADDYNASRIICEPLRLLDAPPICDGAASIILGNKDMAKSCINSGIPVTKILASSVASDELALAQRKNVVRLASAEVSSNRAYSAAGIGPKHIDIFEPHDAYTIMTALSLEAAGFAEHGTGTEFSSEQKIGLQGELPICTFGGLKARGHPVGATGIYQIAECFLQLTQRAGENQVHNACIGMTQNFSGAASVAFTNILEAC
ncbi:thiolase C-terminal domain-containing protein [Marinagarivorans cellulosilyticus]|uniref:Acetyl-CoA C-acetyltransferase n=1 Tax=Marinagarivorans cellulosilyticus TaxID=2721545 RepID=A0AAN1WF60_9GAMM|nr:hypothetical protein [Marinagarivorans cellulosilyticus]BCD96461.1 acetyl-CoA C-acetyltransferase [Marinagarivorans cellulosilyticus]